MCGWQDSDDESAMVICSSRCKKRPKNPESQRNPRDEAPPAGDAQHLEAGVAEPDPDVGAESEVVIS